MADVLDPVTGEFRASVDTHFYKNDPKWIVKPTKQQKIDAAALRAQIAADAAAETQTLIDNAPALDGYKAIDATATTLTYEKQQ